MVSQGSSSSSEERPLLQDTVVDSTHNVAHHASSHLAVRVGAAMYSFVVLGLLQSSIGVMLEPLSQHYSLSDIHVSLIFLVGPVGYILAAQSSDFVHCKWGQRGIAILAPSLHILGVLAIGIHPPFSVILVAFAAIAFGNGFLDGSWCAWATNVGSANTVSGMLQGSFSVGAAAGPFLASTVMHTWKWPWFDWFYVLATASAIELCVLLFAFRHENSSRYRDEKHTGALSAHGKIGPKGMFQYRATWLSAFYELTYVGLEAALSGWLIPYMIRYRSVTPNLASTAASGFWGGMAVGRFVLGTVTDKLGVRRANSIYFLATIALQIGFAFTHERLPSMILMSLIGFFMGPMFASGLVVLTRGLPADLHVAAVSFVASAGQIGAALLPFGIGAFIQTLEIGIFRFAIIILSILALSAWIPASSSRTKHLPSSSSGVFADSGVDNQASEYSQ